MHMPLTTTKYAVCYLAPDYVRQVFDAAYRRVTGRELPVQKLHLSVSYSFFLHDDYSEEWLFNTVASIKLPSIAAFVSGIFVFEHDGRKILYARIEPASEFLVIHKQLLPLLRRGTTYDTSVFAHGILPPFLPHISLDYLFDGDAYTLASLQAERVQAYFDLNKLSVLKIHSEDVSILG